MTQTRRPELVATNYQVFDNRFASCRGDRWLERLYQGCHWAEGPVWVPAGRYLLWSDIPTDRILRWDEPTGTVGVFREPSGNTNGNTLDPSGRLVSCEQGRRRVTRTEHDGSITVLADHIGPHRFNSPNDVVVRSDRSVWFTDPPAGIASHYEGSTGQNEVGGCHVYRVDPAAGECTVVADDFPEPNGLAFSPDERRLFIADSSLNHIRVFDVDDRSTLSGGDVFASLTSKGFDGFRFDDEGRLWAGAAEGVNCYHPDGALLGRIEVPEIVANVAFGGAKRNQLFIAATTSIYVIRLGARGLSLPGRAA